MYICNVSVQGLSFLNLVAEIWTRRGVSDMPLKTQLHSECHKWLFLLLQLIDVTLPKAEVHLRQFIKGRGVARVFKSDITKAVSLLKHVEGRYKA